jgi:hypothetical protein
MILKTVGCKNSTLRRASSRLANSGTVATTPRLRPIFLSSNRKAVKRQTRLCNVGCTIEVEKDPALVIVKLLSSSAGSPSDVQFPGGRRTNGIRQNGSKCIYLQILQDGCCFCLSGTIADKCRKQALYRSLRLPFAFFTVHLGVIGMLHHRCRGQPCQS